jgi:hypothetical protein
MGNFNPWNKTDETSTLSTEENEHVHQQGQGMEEPVASKRHGADGLFDCGFEYRVVNEAATRLFHVDSGVMITQDNRKLLIPDGPIFDEVSSRCQEIAQERVQNIFRLHFVTLLRHEGEPVQALVSPEYKDTHCPVMVIIAGKGKSRAGVLSVKELLVSGVEQGSATFHIQQAQERGWAVILLDPNARGINEGMVLIRCSLDHLDWNHRQVYVLAHSAAGGYLARYLLQSDQRRELLSSIRACVFTDSTHNIQWTKKDPMLFNFLQSHHVLYIRNCSENPSDTFASHKHKQAGEVHEGNLWWRHRFGNILTVWAGTTDHSAVCWVARNIIWDFYAQKEESWKRNRAPASSNSHDVLP